MDKDLDLVLDELLDYFAQYGEPEVKKEGINVTYTYYPEHEFDFIVMIEVIDNGRTIDVKTYINECPNLDLERCVSYVISEYFKKYDKEGVYTIMRYYCDVCSIRGIRNTYTILYTNLLSLFDNGNVDWEITEIVQTNYYREDYIVLQYKDLNKTLRINFNEVDYDVNFDVVGDEILFKNILSNDLDLLYLDYSNQIRYTGIQSTRRRVVEFAKKEVDIIYDGLCQIFGNDFKVSKDDFFESFGLTIYKPIQESYRYRRTPRLVHRNR